VAPPTYEAAVSGRSAMTSSLTVSPGRQHGATDIGYQAELYTNDKHADITTEMKEGSSPIDDTPRQDASSSLFTDSSSEASDSDTDVDQGVSSGLPERR